MDELTRQIIENLHEGEEIEFRKTADCLHVNRTHYAEDGSRTRMSRVITKEEAFFTSTPLSLKLSGILAEMADEMRKHESGVDNPEG